MKLFAPDEDEYEEDYEEYADEDDTPPEPIRHRAEWILGILAGLCAVVLLAMVIVTLPAMIAARRGGSDDPDSVLHSSHAAVEKELMAEPILEETEPSVTTEPTIPPERNPYNQYDFQFNRDNYLICQKQDSYPGVDVSAFQHKIDWQKVADSGIRFAMIRLGFRGYGAAGKLVEDEYAQENLKGAAEAGLAVGAYFFSQATSLQEVEDEIRFMTKILGDTHLDMPLVLDWEVPTADSRTVNVDRRSLTDFLIYYCETVEEMGYQPMVYFNWGQSSRMLYLNELERWPFWLALYQDRMTYPFRVEMWQYTCKGTVPGIDTEVDIDIYMP